MYYSVSNSTYAPSEIVSVYVYIIAMKQCGGILSTLINVL